MPPPLCLLLLLLLLSAPAAALPPEGRPAGPHRDSGRMQAVADLEKSSLLAVLAWWYAGASQASARAVSRRQEGPPPQQGPRPEQVPCKNFFWKTFSSCK